MAAWYGRRSEAWVLRRSDGRDGQTDKHASVCNRASTGGLYCAPRPRPRVPQIQAAGSLNFSIARRTLVPSSRFCTAAADAGAGGHRRGGPFGRSTPRFVPREHEEALSSHETSPETMPLTVTSQGIGKTTRAVAKCYPPGCPSHPAS